MEDLFEINNEAFKPTLLLVDDEENILRSIRRALRPVNVNVLMATSAKQGLDILKDTQVNLIISDMRMPEMSGADFLSEAAQKYPDIPRILMTGYSDMVSTIKAINEGRISNYLPKPWDDDHLKSVVADGLQTTQLQQHNEYLTQQLIEKSSALEAINLNLEKAVESRTQEVVEKSIKLEKAVEQLNQSNDSMVSLVSNILALRDEKGSRAAELKANIATGIATYMQCDNETIRQVKHATLLANIGKMTFRDNTLEKPYNDLSAKEIKDFRKFPIMGEAVLLSISGLSIESQIIRNQFERFNGTGFPDGLNNKDIPLGARIVAIARDYVELVQGRYTGTPFDELKARNEIKKYAGERYDPRIVEAFLAIIDQHNASNIADNKLRLSARDLKVNMSLAKDVYSSEGVILIKKDRILDEHLIEMLINFELVSEETLDIFVSPSLASK